MLRLARTEDALQVSAGAEEGSLLTPLPGTVVAVHVSRGRRRARRAVGDGRGHENGAHLDRALRRNGGAVAFAVGDRVAAGAVLVELTPLET